MIDLKRVIEENKINKSALCEVLGITRTTLYSWLDGKEFVSHEVVNHSKYEYVRGNVTTNTVEGYFGILKRGINGIYHHVSKEHLHRYLAEFDFRYNHRKINDNDRAISAIAGFEGKRLTYRDSLK